MSTERIENLLCEIYNLNQALYRRRVNMDLFFEGQSGIQMFEFRFKEETNSLYLKESGTWIYQGRLNEHGLYDVR